MCFKAFYKTFASVFIGSEESIFEFPAETTANTSANSAAANSNPQPTGALADLIRSRDFVIDFPRVFVLEGSNETRRRSTTFNNGMPERSQSSMGLSQAKDWMCTVANKLEEQHGLRKSRKDSQKIEMQENLLSVRQETLKMRRSQSTEGRYCVRKEQDNLEGACGGQSTSSSCATSRRNSAATVINQFQPAAAAALKFDILNKRRKSNSSLKTWLVKETNKGEKEVQPKKKEGNLPNITIEIVGEDH